MAFFILFPPPEPMWEMSASFWTKFGEKKIFPLTGGTLKGVKKAKFCELRAKLGHLRTIKAGELT